MITYQIIDISRRTKSRNQNDRNGNYINFTVLTRRSGISYVYLRGLIIVYC